MKKTRKALLLASVLLICGCSSSAANTQTPAEEEVLYERDDSAGSREVISLEEAVQKKNAGESFVLLYSKDDCEYCASFNEVLEEYLPQHKLDILEVNMTQAEEMYTADDIEIMQTILSGGLDKTPALYYVESPETVWLLDHTEYNYSIGGLDQWVIANKLDERKDV